MIMVSYNYVDLRDDFLIQQTMIHLSNPQMVTHFPIQVQLKELWCPFSARMMISNQLEWKGT